MNSRDNMRNGIFSAQGSKDSAVLFVAGDNKMKDHTNRTNTIRRAHKMFMALLIALTMMISSAVPGVSAFAANNNDTVRVATYDQLQEALEETKGVKEIVVDPQAAVDEGEVVYSVEGDENNNAFYIGFDEALTVSDDITITSADDVDVYFARSDSFKNDQEKPALLNIESEGNLNLDGLITMTGEEVTTTFYEANEVNPAEFVFSVKSKDGTGEDNEVWNSDQALKGGFYIQNNGGEYTLGDDVVMKDINLADDVEDAEQIQEEKAASSNEEEVVVEKSADAAEEEVKAATEEATQEEEAVVAPAPKRMMMKSAGALRNGGTTTDQAKNLGNGEWEVSSWRQLKNLFASSDTITTVYITKDIIATPIDGETDPVDNPVPAGKKYKSILLNGRTGVTIRGPKTGDPVHIYREKDEGDFPLFTVQNYNNELTLGENLILSGKVGEYVTNGSGDGSSTSLDKYKADVYVVKLRTNDGTNNYLRPDDSTRVLKHDGDSVDSVDCKIVNGSLYMRDEVSNYSRQVYCNEVDESDASAFIQRYTVDQNGSGTPLEVHSDTNGTKASSSVNAGIYYLYDPLNQKYLTKYQDSSQKYFVPAANASDATQFKAYKKGDSFTPVWIINGTVYYDSGEAEDALANDPANKVLVGKEYQWPSSEISSGDNIESPRAFFVQVRDGGTLNIEGAILEDFVTDGDVKHIAPITVSGKGPDGKGGTKSSSLTMDSGEIRNNTVGYGADEDAHSQSNVQELGTLIRDTPPTNTAGAVIFANGAEGTFKEKAKILSNRADAGALIVTSNATVTMKDSKKSTVNGKQVYDLEFSRNIGWHHSGAVLVEDGGTFTLEEGSINNNVAWWKGGAVWATEYGTGGLVRWAPKGYPTKMLNDMNKNKHKKGGNFIMNGGTLDSNFAFARAGAVEVESDGVQLLGGTISNNKCKSLGGGIYVEGDSPIYSYTLTIRSGYIGNNTSVAAVESPKVLDMKLESGKLVEGSKYGSSVGGNHRDEDWAKYGKQHTGDGGGVWLCAMGGTSIFTSDGNEEVIIDNNHAARVNGDTNGYGDDFYISHRHGSALVQNMTGTWLKDENGDLPRDLPIDPQTGGILRGPLGMENMGKPNNGGDYSPEDAAGIKIIDNIGRNGGGLAVNGTVIMGKPADVYRFESEFDFEKIWKGVAQKPVTLKLYYKYDANKDNTIDPETELFELVQEETGEEYKVVFGTSEGVVSNATGNELIYKYDNNKAKASVPLTTTHTDGTVVQLYQIYNEQSPDVKINDESNNEFIDVTDKQDLEKFFKYINNRPDLDIKVKWNVAIKEEGDEFIMTPGDITAKANTKAGDEISLINPDNKEELDKIKVFFDTVKFGQTLTNTPKSTSAEFTKVDGTNAIEGKTATFKLYEAAKNDPNTQWYNWVPVANSARDLSLNTENGKLSIDNLVYGKTYMLFETQAPSGYIREIDPWVISVDNNGGVTVRTLTDQWQNRYWDPTKSGDARKATNNGYDYTENLANKEWPNSWLTSDSTVLNLKNEPFDIKLTKMGVSDEETTPINGAKFALYKSGISDDKLYYEIARGDSALDENIESKTVAASKGVIEFQVPEPGYYFLFETQAPEEHVRQVEPWLIHVDNGGKVVTYKYINSEGDKWVGGGHSEENIPNTHSGVKTGISNSWRGWKRGWYDGESHVVTDNKIENFKRYDLPSAGGMGTYWFMVIGTMMMTFAVTTLITRRKNKKRYN